jgi:hypothetical protein
VLHLSNTCAESVQPAPAAAPGQFGHYGHLQHAPSFNTAAGTAQADAATAALGSLNLGTPSTSDAAAGAAALGTSAGAGIWNLQGPHLPTLPQQQIVGPHVRFNDYDPASGSWAVSVLVVSSPGLAGSTVQLHYAVNAPASQSAQSQVLDEFMGEWSVQHNVQACHMFSISHVHGAGAAAVHRRLRSSSYVTWSTMLAVR